MDKHDKVKDFVKFQIRRNFTNLFKNFFLILEDIELNDEEYQKYRKRILDDANNKLRELEETFDSLNITFSNYEDTNKE